MKKTPKFYEKLFGGQPHADLTQPIRQTDLGGPGGLRAEVARRDALLFDFLKAETAEVAFLKLKSIIFDGYSVVSGSSATHRPNQSEIVQMAGLLAAGKSHRAAARAIAVRQNHRGDRGQSRVGDTIKRAFEDTATHKILGKWLDPAHLALVQSGLLDDITAAAQEHGIDVIYFPEPDTHGFPNELGPLQASILIAAGQGDAQRYALSGRDLPHDVFSELMGAHQAGGHEVAVIAPVGSNSGPRFRDAVMNIGLENVPVIEASGQLAGIKKVTLVLFKNQIPKSVIARINKHLEAVTKTSRKLVAHTGRLSAQNIKG